ncbi:cell division protein FtsA [Novosphingobium sp. FSY-8]|uniref:Cell division protein FtsA n=1 Tax=Novosphingobium ovatum TaxID=1908523 RepID=A0ABW9XE89_9SPHN|nr:cell division protein FtsA [Novosphingobium ovatum]NBC36851.1 cell division protein FtsA [Novosphingobium ovatum]
MAVPPRITHVFGAVNIGSFRVSAMIAGRTENGDILVMGSAHRAAQGVKRGYVTDMHAATYAVRDAIEKAEKMANTSISSVWIGCSGAGLASRIAHVESDMGGRRIEPEDIDHLLVSARDVIQPEGRMVLHAQPAHYTLDGAHGVANPKGLHAERLGVDIHVMLADGAPIRNLTEAVQNAHLQVEAVVASPIAAGLSVLSAEERELGVALVEFGAEVTTVSVHAAGLLLELATIPMGSGDITDAIAAHFGIRRFQAERLKCVNGSALASPADHGEMIPVHGPGEEIPGQHARHADDKNRIPRAELISVITGQLSVLLDEVNKVLKRLGFVGARGAQVVFTGGGAELAGLADFAQGALGRPVRIGKPVGIRGLAEAHATPGYSTLAGLILYAIDEPIDIRQIGPSYVRGGRHSGLGLFARLWHAIKEYF